MNQKQTKKCDRAVGGGGVEEAAVQHGLHCVHQRDREPLASGRDLRYRTCSSSPLLLKLTEVPLLL